MINGLKFFDCILCWGMVGGGDGSQIGYIYCFVVLCDNIFMLLVGVFDIDVECGCQFG